MNHLLSFESCLHAAAEAIPPTQVPEHLWAIQEGLLRAASAAAYAEDRWELRKSRRKRTCEVCHRAIAAGEHFFAVCTEHAPWHYVKESCVACMARRVVSLPNLDHLPPITGTHWDLQTGSPVNLTLPPKELIRQAVRHTRSLLQEQIARDTLILLVWSLSTVQVGQALGISDVAVRKRCLARQIPKPGRGFWAKVAEAHLVAHLIPEEIKAVLGRYGYAGHFQNWQQSCGWLHHQEPQREVTQVVRKILEVQTSLQVLPADADLEQRKGAFIQEWERS